MNLLESFTLVEDNNTNEERSTSENEDLIIDSETREEISEIDLNPGEVAHKENEFSENSGGVARKEIEVSEVTEHEDIEGVEKTLRPRTQAVVYQEDADVDQEELLLNEILGTEEEDEFVPAPEDEDEEEFDHELITRQEILIYHIPSHRIIHRT